MPVSKITWRRRLALGSLAPFVFLLLGFDLDEGELKCEQAAAHVQECCPDVTFPRLACIQQGGCDREEDETLVARDESDCLRDLSCDELAERDICARIAARIARVGDVDGPTIQELYEEDWLCE